MAFRYGDKLRRFLSKRLRNVAEAPDLAQPLGDLALFGDRKRAVVVFL